MVKGLKYGDNWIPGHQALYMEDTIIMEEQRDDIVESIINENTKWFQVNKIRALFNPKVAADKLTKGLLLETRKDLLFYEECFIRHVCRLGKEIAHMLARYTYNVESLMMQWDCIPHFISQVVCLDKCL